MSIKRVCGAECQINATGLGTASDRKWGAVNGTVGLNTGFKRSGTQCFEFVGNATTPYLQHTCVASRTIAYLKVYFALQGDASPAADAILFQFNLAAGTDPDIRVLTTGVVQARIGAGATQSWAGGASIALDTWYGVEVEVDVSGGTTTMKWRTWTSGGGWVDQANVTLSQSATTVADIKIGQQGNTDAGTAVEVDDIIIGDGTTAGEDFPASATNAKNINVKRYKPVSDGTHSFTAGDFGYNSGGSDVATSATDVYTYLDEDDMKSVTDLIRQKVIRTTGYCEVHLADESDSSLSSIQAVGFCGTHHSSGTGANGMGVRLNYESGTVLWSTDISDTTAHYRATAMALTPDGNAWTRTNFNSNAIIRFGFSGDVSAVPYLDSVAAEVAWIIPPEVIPQPPYNQYFRQYIAH